jgi:hypothetical protein
MGPHAMEFVFLMKFVFNPSYLAVGPRGVRRGYKPRPLLAVGQLPPLGELRPGIMSSAAP